MSIQAIKDEIKQTKTQLKKLENELFNRQNQCNHRFIEFKNYQQCERCYKSEPLYY